MNDKMSRSYAYEYLFVFIFDATCNLKMGKSTLQNVNKNYMILTKPINVDYLPDHSKDFLILYTKFLFNISI